MQKPWNPLSLEEAHIIEHQGTERPFTGEYDNHFANGLYVCRRCNAPLYRSIDKFKSSCGWPSFDDELPNAIHHLPDSDGHRIEIRCQQCDGHLGHVFSGEHYTAKNLRHCVNSLSMRFIDFNFLLHSAVTNTVDHTHSISSSGEAHDSEADAVYMGVNEEAARGVQRSPKLERRRVYQAILIAGGCFWGIEYFFEREPGVLVTCVGYAGGSVSNPNYQQVCTGTTDHAETVAVIFDPTRTSVSTLYQLFFEIHDPTQFHRQGPDIGSQYRSAIFYMNDYQKHLAEEKIEQLKKHGVHATTELLPYSQFWQAEAYHHHYFSVRNEQPTCHIRRPSN